MRLITTLLTTIIITLTTNSIYASAVFTGGHADIGMAEEDGLALHFHAEGATINGINGVEAEYEPDKIVISIPDTAKNGSLWILPQSHEHKVPFLGIGTGEADSGKYENDTINFTLLSMTSAPTGGNFSLWQTDAFNKEIIFMSTENGINTTDTISLALGHSHYNWGFSAPGIYELQFEASAELASGGIESSIGTFTFEVVPEPASALLMISAMSMLFKRR